MAALDEFQTALAAVRTAMAAADYASAYTQYAIAEAALAEMALESETGEVQMRMRDSLDGLGRAISRAESHNRATGDTRRLTRTGTTFQR